MPVLTWTGARFELRCKAGSGGEVRDMGFHHDWRGQCYWTGLLEVARKMEQYADDRAKAKLNEVAQQIGMSRAVSCNENFPHPEGLEYLPFQKAGIAYALQRPYVLIADEPGLGKTIQAIGVINSDPTVNKILVVCPASITINWARELQKWTTKKLTGDFATSKYLPDTDIVIANYEIMHKLKDKINSRTIPFDMHVYDECFPAETLVLTEQGFKKIKEIVKSHLTLRVGSFNLETGVFEWKRILGFLKKERRQALVQIKHSKGRFTCTASHKIYVKGKLKRADELCPGDELQVLRTLQQSISNEDGKKILQRFVQREIHQQSASVKGCAQREQGQKSHSSKSTSFLSILWEASRRTTENILLNALFKKLSREDEKGVSKTTLTRIKYKRRKCSDSDSETINNQSFSCSSTISGRTEEKLISANLPFLFEKILGRQKRQRLKKVLFKELQRELSCLTTRMENCLYREVGGCSETTTISGTAGCILEKNERKQSFPNAGSFRTPVESASRQNIYQSWREWTVNETTNEVDGTNRIDTGISNQNCKSLRNVSFTTLLLQSGFSSSRIKDCDRSRRRYSSIQTPTMDRSQEDESVGSSWVESVEILEQGNRREPESCGREDQFVYCLEVEGNHNFFADGVLVSNCHRIKNPEALCTRACLGAENVKNCYPLEARRKLFLTGTPILNRPVELWPMLRVIDPENLGSNFWLYAKKFCNAENQPRGMRDFSGASNLDILSERLRSSLMIRRLKADVMPELPAKRRQIIAIPLPPKVEKTVQKELEFYNNNQATIEAAIRQAEIAQAAGDKESYIEATKVLRGAKQASFEELAKLRHDTAVAKVPYIINYLEEALEEHNKIVLFGHHQDFLNPILEKFQSIAVKLDGNMSTQQKQLSVDRFQTEPGVKLFVASITAAGIGITLTAASYAIFGEILWTPALLSQAEDRLHRIGQRSACLIHHVVFDRSVDANVAKVLIEKQANIEKALGD